ncbi:MAG: hypothetical protein IJ760_03420 [Bacteroidales bacterium]|nr:hypothetical protein [Bacteroidales bacterium]
MRRLLLVLLLAAALPVRSQDTAATVVGRYLAALNHDAIHADSLLVINTSIRVRGSDDTLLMRRYCQAGGMVRVEVWRGDTLTDGFCTNGSTRHRQFFYLLDRWEDVPPHDFALAMQPYDFRGPLYQWEHLGVRLSYRGVVTIDGKQFQVVRADQKMRYQRFYYFDPDSGLLSLVIERGSRPEDDRMTPDELLQPPIAYKCEHEYMSVGGMLIPSLESFQRGGVVTILHSEAHLAPRDNLLFNRD